MQYQYIDSGRKLSRYLDNLRENAVDIIALDIEGDSNLHHYGEKLCLIQVFDGSNAVLIDPFKVPMEPVKQLIEDRTILKIMYDGPSDRAFLYKNCGMDILSVLDLRVAVELLDFDKKDLGSILREVLGIDSGKSKKRLQRYNWSRRPLDDYAIEYALGDVLHLFDLKDRLLDAIIEKRLLDSFILWNLRAQNKPHAYNTRPKLLRSKRYREIKGVDRAVFKRLFQIREDHAKEIDYPANSLFADEMLFDLVAARARPQDIKFGKRIPVRTRDRIIKEIEGVIIDSA